MTPDPTNRPALLLVHGGEPLLIDERVLAFERGWESAVPGIRTLHYRLPGDPRTLLEALSERSLFDDDVLAVVTGIPAPHGAPRGEQGSWDALVTGIRELAPGVRLAIALHGTIPVSHQLCVAVKESGGKIDYVAPLKGPEKRKWCLDTASELGMRIPADVAEEIISTSKGNLRLVRMELDKLAAYAESAPLTRKIVDRLVVGGEESTVWKLVDALADGDRKTAMREFQAMEQDGRPATYVISALGGQLHDVLKVAFCGEERMTLSATVERLKLPAWRVERMKRQASRFTGRRLAAWITELATLDVDIKSGRATESGLELFLLRAIAEIS